MGSVLSRYLTRLFLQRTVATVAALVGLLTIVDMFDITSEILSRGLGLAGLAHYELLRVPGMVQQILPISVLIGALVTFAGLARSGEMSALRSTGITIYRIVLILLPAAAVLATAHFVIADQIAPRSEQALSIWWNATEPVEEAEEGEAPAPRWFRADGYLVLAESASADGRRLDGLRIYRRDSGARLTELSRAESAILGPDGQWRLQGAAALAVGADQVTAAPVGQRIWDAELAPSDVVSVFSPQDRISSLRAWRAVTGERPASRSPAFYITRVQRALAEPVAVFVMLLLSAPAALAHQRHSQASLMMFCLGAGLLFLILDGVLTALGQTNVLPPLLGAWAGPALFAALGGAALVYLEG